jgi:hypothetical protein
MEKARIPALMAVLLIPFLRLDSTRAQDTAIVRATEAPPNGMWVDSLDLGKIRASWLRSAANRFAIIRSVLMMWYTLTERRSRNQT